MKRLVPLLLLPLLFVASARAEDEEKKAQPPDRFLRDWVRGEATFEITPDYHRLYDRSPHRRSSERYEVAIKCFFLRKNLAAKKVGELAAELALIPPDEERDEAVRARALHVLGRLRVLTSVPTLVTMTKSENVTLRNKAAEALGFFGSRPAEESFLIFGGRVRYAVFPPAPAPAATMALVARFVELRSAKPKRGKFRPEFPVVLDALESHAHDELARVAIESLLQRFPGQRLTQWLTVRDRLLGSAAVVELDRLNPLLANEVAWQRKLAVEVLGWSARREAAPPLLTALGDEDDEVVTAARQALARLSGIDAKDADFRQRLGPRGEKLDLAKAERWPEKKPGIFRLGR